MPLLPRTLVGVFGDDDHGYNSGSAFIYKLNNPRQIGVNVNGLLPNNTVSFINNGIDSLTVNVGGITYFTHTILALTYTLQYGKKGLHGLHDTRYMKHADN